MDRKSDNEMNSNSQAHLKHILWHFFFIGRDHLIVDEVWNFLFSVLEEFISPVCLYILICGEVKLLLKLLQPKVAGHLHAD